MSMAEWFGTALCIGGAVHLSVLLHLGKIQRCASLVGHVVILAFAIAVANLAAISKFAMSAGGGTFEVQLREVQARASEVREIENRVKELAAQVEEGERNIRQAYQALFASIAFIVETRDQFGLGDLVEPKVRAQIETLGKFAYPDAMGCNPTDLSRGTGVRSATFSPAPQP